MSSDDPRDLIGAYVLDACSPEEAAQVRAHMKVSPEFRAEVESFGDLRRALLEVPAPEVTPSPGLKASVMAQVRAEASLFAAAGGGEAGRGAASEAPRASDLAAPAAYDGPSVASGAAPARGAGTPAPTPRRGAFLTALRSPARATALAALLVALIVGGVVLGSGSGATEYNGRPTFNAGADATVRLVAKDGDNKLRLSGFPQARGDREYQVWLRTGNEDPRPTKVLFQVDEQGNAEATIPGDLGNVDDVLVTAEPKGGSQTPTSDPVLHVQI